MTIFSYPQGSLLRLTVTFENAQTNVATDPTVVTLQVGTPAGITTTSTYGVGMTIQKTAAGMYYADVEANEAGTWNWYWRGTGAVIAARDGTYTVTPSGF